MAYREIKVGQVSIRYFLRRSKKAKHIRLTVDGRGEVVLTVPHGLVDESIAERFVLAKAHWLADQLKNLNKKRENKIVIKGSHQDYLAKYDDVLKEVTTLVNQIRARQEFSYNNIFIKNTISQWGSCSLKHNLNFNYKIIYLPKSIRDYIIIHELCHLEYFNHSVEFWQRVETFCPDYQVLRKQLRGYTAQ